VCQHVNSKELNYHYLSEPSPLGTVIRIDRVSQIQLVNIVLYLQVVNLVNKIKD
jgi:hypothetical protein